MSKLTQSKASRLSTNEVSNKLRSAYWNDMICDVYVELECDKFENHSFSGSIEKYEIDGLELSKVETDPHHVIRSKQQISKSLDDCFLLSLQVAGKCKLIQDGREAWLNEGDFVLYDSTRPYELCFPEQIRQLVLKVPRDTMKSHISVAETHTAITVPGQEGLGRMASRLLTSFGNQIHSLNSSAERPVVDNTLGLVSTALFGQFEEKPTKTDETDSRRILLHRIKTYILANLSDPDLCVDSICKVNRLSPRYLHSLFEQENTTITRWIWQQRLESARRDLLDPCHQGTPITQVCYRWGFKDTAHFSRAYKKQFGKTPRQDRSA